MTAYTFPFGAPIGASGFGFSVTFSPHVPAGEMWDVGGALLVGPRPPDTPADEGRRIVREGMADVLDWLGPHAPNMRTPGEAYDDLWARR